MSDQLTIPAPAKINLFLKVMGKRADGYHDIYSLMQAIDLRDELTISRINAGVEIECDTPGVPTDDSNLVARAWHLMQSRYRLPGGVRIKLQKRIPSGAGLGGGSSDAAAAIKAFDQLFGLSLARPELEGLGAELGSDVPFFFSSGSAVVEGRGEQITDVTYPLNYQIVLILPDFRVETKRAYDGLRNSLTKYSTKSRLPVAISGASFYAMLTSIGNDFQALVCSWYPGLESAIKELCNAGAPYVALSGSGSAFFALFESLPDSSMRKELAGRIGWPLVYCKPVRL